MNRASSCSFRGFPFKSMFGEYLIQHRQNFCVYDTCILCIILFLKCSTLAFDIYLKDLSRDRGTAQYT